MLTIIGMIEMESWEYASWEDEPYYPGNANRIKTIPKDEWAGSTSKTVDVLKVIEEYRLKNVAND